MVLTKKTVNRIWGLLTAALMSVTGLAMAVATAQPAQVVAADGPVGYGAGTTGGAGGTSVTVSTGDQFLAALDSKADNVPLTIYVDGTITLDNTAQDELLMKDMSDISVIGVADRGECNGIGIRMVRCENIIIQNMEIHHVLKGAGEGDSISIENSGYVWVDHCELYNVYDGDESKKDVYDGLLDCKKNSHHLTYSYNYLHDSWKTMLCGFSDNDNYDRTFTMHHNIFENSNSRLPLFRFGHAHIYNNYYHDIYTSGINTRMGAEVFVENNIFDNVKEPVCSLDSKAIGYWNLSGNQFIGCTAANTSTETSQSWSENMANTSTYKPDYAYTAEGTDTLLDTLKKSCGVGKLDSTAPVTPGTTAPTPTTTTAPAVTTVLGITTAPPTTTPSVEPVAGAIYCAPNGSDSASGTMDNPMTAQKAIDSVQPGGTIYCLGGVYNLSSTIKVAESNSGTEHAYKTISALPGASVTFDFSAMALDNANRGVSMEGSYWHWYGIRIQGAGDNGMILAGSHNVLELCQFTNNRDTGLQISRVNTSYSDISQWPSYNTILNCTASNNCDEATMENADGFAAKLTCGVGNVFDGCMSYNNSDDGWDLFAKSATGPIGAVTLRNCIAFRNGWTEDGRGGGDCDGNGFKLGGSGVGTAHVLENCIAFENLHHGFTDNNNPLFGSLTNCTSFANSKGGGKANFQMDRCTAGTFTNLLSYVSYGNCASDKFVGKIGNSVYYNSSKYYQVGSMTDISKNKIGDTVTGPQDSDFISVTAPAEGTDFHTVWRNPDGSITTNGFLMLAENSGFQGMGAVFSTQEQPPVVTTTAPAPVTTTTTTTTTEPQPEPVYGDVNCHGEVEIGDVVLLARYVAQDASAPITPQGVQNADCDKNQVVDSSDITIICRYLAHLTDTL